MQFIPIQIEAISHIPDKRQAFESKSPDRILKRFLFEIIDRSLLSQFTWSGKTKKSSSTGKDKKIAFKKSKNLCNLLIKLVKTKITEYDEITFEKHMVNKILKYAYR